MRSLFWNGLVIPAALAAVLTACGSPPPPAISTIAPTRTPAPVGVTESAPAATEAAPVSAPAPTPTTGPDPYLTYGPNDYPPNVNPLTGEVVVDPARLSRRPVAIKISNFPRVVRPQSGLSLADLVFEHYAEGGTTRFTAVYLGNDADKVGSVRSARFIDAEIVQMYKSVLVTSGSSLGTMAKLRSYPFFDRVISEESGYSTCPPLCRDVPEDTNTLFTSTQVIWNIAAAKSFNEPQDLRGLAFREAPPEGGRPATRLHIQYSQEARAEWRYNPISRRYERWADISATDLIAQFDALNGNQLTAANVIVLFVNHVATHILEDYENGGHYGFEIQLWGAGSALVLRDGSLYEATWVRLTPDGMVGVVDEHNAPIPLRPGNTWFEIVHLTSSVTASADEWRILVKVPAQTGNYQTPTPEGGVAETPTATP